MKGQIKTTDWLIRGISKEQLEREKQEAIMSSDLEECMSFNVWAEIETGEKTVDYDYVAEKMVAKGYHKQSEKIPSKGCEYCKGRAYTKKPLTVITKYGRRIELVFEFCPNCGRKMKGGE